MVNIEKFIEVCGNEDVEEVTRLLNSKTRFLPFKKYFQTEFINTVHNGTTALIVAIKNTDPETVGLLLDRGADMDLRGENSELSPFLLAAMTMDDGDVIRLMLEQGFEVDTRLGLGMTALHTACIGGQYGKVRVLLEHGASIDLQDDSGRTALSYALEKDFTHVIEEFARVQTAVGTDKQGDVQAILDDTSLADLNSNSTKMMDNILPEICFVGAPFEGNAPHDIADWVSANRDLMIAKILGIEDPEAFEQLQARIEKQGVSTILIPDISSNEIESPYVSKGSMLDRSLRVMTQEMSLIPNDYEYLNSVFRVDALERCSPVSFCFVFRKETI